MNNTTTATCASLLAKLNSTTPSFTYEEILQLAICTNRKVKVTNEPADMSHYLLVKRLTSAYTIIFIATSLLGVLGNSIVITAYVKQLRYLNPCRFLNLHLACCDFMFAIMQTLMVLPAFTGKFGELKWPFGLELCKISRTCLELGSFIALSTILIIAIERYQAILYPLRAISNAKSRVKKALIVAWLLGLLSSVPVILTFKIHPKHGHCYSDWSTKPKLEKAFNFYVLIVFAACPLVVITYCYCKIIRALKKPKEGMGIFTNLPQQEMKRRQKSEMRIIKMLVIVVIAFFICVLPKRIVNIILNFIGNHLPAKEAFIYSYVGFLPYPLHVAVNPFIYSLRDRKFLANAFCKPKEQQSIFSGKATSSTELSDIKLLSIKQNK